jgi:hypothetical protein
VSSPGIARLQFLTLETYLLSCLYHCQMATSSQPTVSQSCCQAPIWGPRPDLFITVRKLGTGVLMWDTFPTKGPTDQSITYCWPSPVHSHLLRMNTSSHFASRVLIKFVWWPFSYSAPLSSVTIYCNIVASTVKIPFRDELFA